PEQFHDDYREQVLALIERKAQGKAIAVQPPPQELAQPAPDLMSALKASLEAVRAREGAGMSAPKARKAAAKKPAAKKPAAKQPGASRISSKR
ncbi:MAG TPA: Ku protein, partial [Solirubrobacteraceae bacterium]|nr:Ku protein [Solirubrobacteraceae bacterium]